MAGRHKRAAEAYLDDLPKSFMATAWFVDASPSQDTNVEPPRLRGETDPVAFLRDLWHENLP